MRIESAKGLVLRTYPLTETSLIVHWLTAEHGRIATVAKGARRPRSSFHGKLDLFYEAEFTFHRSQRSELHTLREVKVQSTHRALRCELGYLQQAAYFAALVDAFTETETPLLEIFDLLRGALAYLPVRPPHASTVLAFEMKLLSELGVEPNVAENDLSESAKGAGKALLEANWPTLAGTKLDTAIIGELKILLQRSIAFQLGRLPKGREAALECS